MDYLTNPFARDRISEDVLRGVESRSSAVDSRQSQEALEREVRARQARLADAIAALRLDSDNSLDAMLAMLTPSCHDAYAHAHRVATLAVGTARELNLDAADIVTIEQGALLHDVGKLVMPEWLLLKPAPLTDHERWLIRQHPTVGCALIERVPFLERAAAIVRDAHERVDGLGYPRGTRGDEVSIGARIVCVADAYDTMTRPRSYRAAVSPPEAIVELARCADTQFDRGVVDAFRRVIAAQ